MRSHLTWTAALLMAGAAGCASDKPGTGSPSDLNSQITGAISLEKFASCEDVEGYLKDMAIEQIELQYEGMKSGDCWGWGCGAYRGGEPGAVDLGGAEGAPQAGSDGEATAGGGNSAPPAEPKSEGGGDNEYSDTNTQEAGVDEADFVKTDGEYIYVLRGSNLLVIDAVPAAEAHEVSATTVQGAPREMFLHGDQLVVFSAVWPWDAEGVVGTIASSVKSYDEMLVITIFDIADRAAPKVVRQTLAEASYVSARLVGDTAHVVARTNVVLPGLDYYGWYDGGGVSGGNVGVDSPPPPNSAGVPEPMPADGPTDEGDDDSPKADSAPAGAPVDDREWEDGYTPQTKEEWTMGLDDAKAAAIAKVQAMSLGDLVPSAWYAGPDGTPSAPELLTACTGIYRPTVAYGPSMVTIITIDLKAPTTTQPNATIVGNGDTVYGSGSALYVASDLFNGWYGMWPDADEDWQVTAIHKFDIATTPGAATYVASGKVPGHVLNQFSMSEHDGNLRVATTKEVWTGDGESESQVTVLGPALQQLGSVGGLGKGERIYSARFIGDKGYVVTFRQTDPLYTLDLSNPAAPAVKGELKIPGFSTYIHPMDDGHLLTIGRDTLDNGDWVQQNGVQLTIFDVTDLANPKQAHKAVIGDSGTHSDALYDHQAFNYFPAKGVLAIPLSDGGGAVSTGGGSGSSGSAGAPAFEEETDEPSDTPDSDPAPPSDAPDSAWMPFAGAAIYEVSTETGFDERGVIDHASFMDGSYQYEQVDRTVIIGDAIYTLGHLGMKVCNLADLKELASVTFPKSQSGQGKVPVEVEPAF
jgi:uncharacterized secreted protein with C-terminal beta-propeller domain